MGMAIGYIPLSEIINYALTLGHVEDDIQDFIEIIQETDEGYLEVINKPSQSSTPNKKSKG